MSGLETLAQAVAGGYLASGSKKSAQGRGLGVGEGTEVACCDSGWSYHSCSVPYNCSGYEMWCFCNGCPSNYCIGPYCGVCGSPNCPGSWYCGC